MQQIFYLMIATLCLLDAVPEMRLCADLSHFVVDREFKLPLDARDAGLIQRIIARSDSFQGRVASRQQIQLQLNFPQHQKWVDLFRQWWRDGLVSWRQRNLTTLLQLKMMVEVYRLIYIKVKRCPQQKL